jgi:polyribonucleotide nucleotidyltransferase
MEEADEKIELNDEVLPKLELFSVDPSRIVDIIGQAGKTIREIIERFEVSIDLDREKGEVKIAGDKKQQVEAAKDYIIEITQKDNSRGGFKGRGGSRERQKDAPEFKPGSIYEGEVKRIVDFGAFVGLPGDIDGLLHVSKIAKERVNNVNDYLKEGEMVKVKILEQKGHKISLELIEKV